MNNQGLEAKREPIGFRFSTEAYSITGRISTMHRRLSDLLNAEHNAVMVCEDVAVQRRGSLHADLGAFDFASVKLDAIFYAVPIEEKEEEAPVRPKDPSTWVRKRSERVMIVAEPYEITGDVHLAEGAEARNILQSIAQRFLAVTDATIRRTDEPEFLARHDAILLNRAMIHFIVNAR